MVLVNSNFRTRKGLREFSGNLGTRRRKFRQSCPRSKNFEYRF